MPILRLANRAADLALQPLALLVPALAVATDVTALDLHHGDPDARPGDQHVQLTLPVALEQPHRVEQRSVVGQLVAQRVPDGTLRVAVLSELRLGRVTEGHNALYRTSAT